MKATLTAAIIAAAFLIPGSQHALAQRQQSKKQTAPPPPPQVEQPLPVFLQGKQTTNVVGEVVSANNQYITLKASTRQWVNVQKTAGGPVKRGNGTIGYVRPTYGMEYRWVPYTIYLKGYPDWQKVKPGDRVATTGIIYSAAGGIVTVYYHYVPPRTRDNPKVWK